MSADITEHVPAARSPRTPRQIHVRAVATLVAATFLWSLAGAVTRHLEAPIGSAITLWRSLFAGLFVIAYLVWQGRPLTTLRAAGMAGLASGCLWAAMFCCFMIALTRTTVANTLIVYSTSPLLTACLSALVLKTRIGASTWTAIAVALAGLAFMFGANLDITHTAGMGIAFGVPVASALNIVLMKKVGAQVDLIPALAVGCVVSIAATLPFAWPLSTSLHDVLLLAFLGVVQLGIPCVMMVRAVAHLSAPEASVIDLLEIVFGVLWAWLAAGETPEARTLVGGLAVLAGVVLCEVGAGVTPRQVRI